MARRPQKLLTPGPTSVPPEVLRALAEPVLHHRSPDFAEVFAVAQERLRQVFRTDADVLVLTSSGTGAFESALVNLLSPGDRVLAVSQGEFGERWQKMATALGCDVVPLAYAWGESPRPGRPVRRTRREWCGDGVPRPLRDLDGCRQRARAAASGVRRRRSALDRRRRLEPRRRAAGNGRLGSRRRRHGLPEGAHDTARACLRRGLGAGVERGPRRRRCRASTGTGRVSGRCKRRARRRSRLRPRSSSRSSRRSGSFSRAGSRRRSPAIAPSAARAARASRRSGSSSTRPTTTAPRSSRAR